MALCCAAHLGSTLAAAQAPNWAMTGGDAGQSGVQKVETKFTKDTVSTSFKFLWKVKLARTAKEGKSFSEPLLATRLINAQGFKDIVFWSSADTVYAVDSELGNLLWKKQFKSSTPATRGCEVSSLSIVTEPPVSINFNAVRRPATATTPRQPPPAPTIERRLGATLGGGGFRLKGIYVLAGDGMLHEQVMTTGADFGPPQKFLPNANATPFGLNILGKTIYTATGRGCGGVPNGVWAIDMTSANYPVTSFLSQKVRPLTLTGPIIAPDGSSYIITGSGASDADAHPNSVVALGSDLKVKDWYTAGAEANIQNVSPVTFLYKGKQLLVAPGKDGSFVLLDAAALGGADHHTALSTTSSFFKAGEKHIWDGLSAWTDKDGTTWVFASLSGGITANNSAAKMNGSPTHGGVVAFRVEDADQVPVLIPAWVSNNMTNPTPPRIANGVVIVLSGGNASTHAILYVLDAMTGAVLYSSKDTIPTYTRFSGVAVGDSHAFFTDHDGTLYSFGIGLEH